MAAVSGNKEIIKLLVDGGADINAADKEGRTVLIYAVDAKKAEAAKYLIALGADTTLADDKGRTALDYANAMGMVQLVEAVSAGNAGNTDSFGNTALHQACYNNQSEVVKAMLAKDGVDINACNDEKLTPLYIAAAEDNLLIAELLMESGADVNIGDNYGDSPLYCGRAVRKRGGRYLCGYGRAYGSLLCDGKRLQ